MESTTTTLAFFSPSISMEMQSFAFALRPGTNIPQLIAARGETRDTDRPEPALIVAFDFPQHKADALSKPEQETRDVDAFLRDLLPAGRITSASITNPYDPPDVLAYIDGNEVGIEAAQFLPSDSELDKSNSIVGRWMTFEAFRNKVLEHGPSSVAQHRDLLVIMHFGGQSNATPAQRLPPKRANLGSAIAALRTAEPIVQGGTSAGAESMHITDVARWSSDKSIFFAWTTLPPWYSSPFYNQMGFELALGYHATVTRSNLRDELRRIVADHDTEKTETLVVTANGPLRSGLAFPTNGLIASMLFEDEQPLDGWTPSNITRIALHDQDEQAVKWILGSNPWN